MPSPNMVRRFVGLTQIPCDIRNVVCCKRKMEAFPTFMYSSLQPSFWGCHATFLEEGCVTPHCTCSLDSFFFKCSQFKQCSQLKFLSIFSNQIYRHFLQSLRTCEWFVPVMSCHFWLDQSVICIVYCCVEQLLDISYKTYNFKKNTTAILSKTAQLCKVSGTSSSTVPANRKPTIT